MNLKDYIVYIHTDSLYIQLEGWLIDQGVDIEKWNKLDVKLKIDYIERISKEIEDYINDLSLNETQLLHYNSQVTDIAIVFEQEKIALSGIFAAKARYATWTLMNDGKWKDEMSITGMEIIRSDSPEIVKPMVKGVLEMLLKERTDEEISKEIRRCRKILKKCSPSEIAENKGINKIKKYSIDPYENQENVIEELETKSVKAGKGTPHQVKGAINFRFLMDKLNLGNKYESPMDGSKGKVVYIQKNPFGMESLSFIDWPEEFDRFGIKVDYNKMIENNFTKKCRMMLSLVGKEDLLDEREKLKSLFD